VRRVSLETLIKNQLTSMTLVFRFRHMSSARSTSDGRGPVTHKEFRIGRSQGNLARTPDVAVATVISLKLVYTPVDDNVTTPLCSKQASKAGGYLSTLRGSAFSSDAGYADLPLALLGAPVDIGALVKTWVTVSGSEHTNTKSVTCL
jgi:hypothetical protein